MPVFFQVLAAGLGLAFVVVIANALIFIGDELEDSAVWPLARFLKALSGGVMWAILGGFVAAGLFVIGIVVRAIFFRPVISFYLFQLWAFNLGLMLIVFYFIWGMYHGARNRLPQSLRFRRNQTEPVPQE